MKKWKIGAALVLGGLFRRDSPLSMFPLRSQRPTVLPASTWSCWASTAWSWRSAAWERGGKVGSASLFLL